MNTMTLTAGLLAATLLAGATAASAKDASWSLTVVSDQGYVQIGAKEHADEHPGDRPLPHGYVAPRVIPAPAPAYKGHRKVHHGAKHRHRKVHPAPRYGHRGHHFGPGAYYGRGYSCLYPREVWYSLRARGWHGVRPVGRKPGVVFVRASRPNGRSFRLKVDRCTGEILKARPVGYSYRPFPYWRGARPAY